MPQNSELRPTTYCNNGTGRNACGQPRRELVRKPTRCSLPPARRFPRPRAHHDRRQRAPYSQGKSHHRTVCTLQSPLLEPSSSANQPLSDARHAGYSYSGPCAAWAYKCLDLTNAKRIFILGPSHTYYLRGCALTTNEIYATPLGNLTVDDAAIAALRATNLFTEIPRASDEDEHSLEMHLPYLVKLIKQTSQQPQPTIVPILVGDNNLTQEAAFGAVLAEWLRDPQNVFVVSSDFCHWGSRFSYTRYVPGPERLDELRTLGRRGAETETPIHEGIRVLDQLAMDAVASGSHEAFVDNLATTGNTVCGRHPIGVMMAALEKVREEGGAVAEGDGVFKFVRYERSSLAESVSDSSVSYASAYAIV